MRWCALLLLACGTTASALTPLQEWAKQEATLDGGVDQGALLVAILTHESSLCEDRRQTDGHGCGQILYSTAHMFDPLVDERALDYDRSRNIQDAALYLRWCSTMSSPPSLPRSAEMVTFSVTWMRTVACYRHGWPKAKTMSQARLANDPYVRAILALLQ